LGGFGVSRTPSLASSDAGLFAFHRSTILPVEPSPATATSLKRAFYLELSTHMARPSKFKQEFVEQARKLALLGATDREIADFFGVCEKTLNTWKLDNEAFLQSLKSGKEAADERVERSLFHRAIGYSHDAVKIFNNQGAIVTEAYTEHYPPDTTAALFWLKNRRPAQWRDKQEIEQTLNATIRRAEEMTDDELANIAAGSGK
jgi:hypothetical protein